MIFLKQSVKNAWFFFQLLTLSGLSLATQKQIAFAERLPLDGLKLPPGFEIRVFADNVPGARSFARGQKGTLFVGTRDVGKVYAVIDRDGDFIGDSVQIVASGLNMPNGVAFRDGALYVAEVNRVLRYDGIEDSLNKPPAPVVVSDKFPTETSHGWKFIRFGPDNRLYVPVGAPCNVCESKDPHYASITRMSADGTGLEVFVRGVRNSVGFDWHPVTKELWFTNNGRDWLGDNAPSDTLHYAPKEGMNFGFPYCHAGKIADPEFGIKHKCAEFDRPAAELGPHHAPLGMRFYTGHMFPAKYENAIFLAEHGSWNSSVPVGYRLAVVTLDGNKVAGNEVFADGWLKNGKPWGRPVDLEVLPDGSMLVSDDFTGAIYRITYNKTHSEK